MNRTQLVLVGGGVLVAVVVFIELHDKADPRQDSYPVNQDIAPDSGGIASGVMFEPKPNPAAATDVQPVSWAHWENPSLNWAPVQVSPEGKPVFSTQSASTTGRQIQSQYPGASNGGFTIDTVPSQ